MQEDRVTRNMTYWREEKPKNNGWKVDFWLLILAIVIALTSCLINGVV